MEKDALQILPLEKWAEVETLYESDFPRSICGYTALKTHKKWIETGCDYGFKVYCPYGEPRYGIVDLTRKDHTYRVVVIQCPTDDTSKLRKALIDTKLIDWDEAIFKLPFCPSHVESCIRSVANELNLYIPRHVPSYKFILGKETHLYKIESLPPQITIQQLSLDHVELVNSSWPHNYPSSDQYFTTLINAKQGYGLFEGTKLICWVLNDEFGVLRHLYTVKECRGKGFAETLLKLVTNALKKEGNDVIVFCVKENEAAKKLYTKLGFKELDLVAWTFLKRKDN